MVKKRRPNVGQIGTRKRGNYTPVPKQLRVAVRHIAGETTGEIAKNEQLSKNTVNKILRQPEIDRAMAVYRSELTGLVPLALKGLERWLGEANPDPLGRIGSQARYKLSANWGLMLLRSAMNGSA